MTPPKDFFDTDHPPESYGFPDHDDHNASYEPHEEGGSHGGGDYGSSPHFKV